IPLQDTVDRALTRNRNAALFFERPLYGRCTVLTQRARLLQLLAKGQDARLDRALRPFRCLTRARGAVGPIDPIKTLVPRPLDPQLHGAQTHLEGASHLAQRVPPADGGNDLPPLPFGCRRAFLDMSASDLAFMSYD